jgi:hypothetical protein
MRLRLHTHGVFAISLLGLVLCLGIAFFGVRLGGPRREPRLLPPVLTAQAPSAETSETGAPPMDRLHQAKAAPKMAIESSDDMLMQKLRNTVDVNPTLALQLAQDGQNRFGESGFADERAFLRMRAQVNLRDIASARQNAEQFFRRYPQSPFAERVFRLTGMHPPAPTSASPP